MRADGRANHELRPVSITRRFTDTPAGSVLWQQGKTIVWCTASITQQVPPWFSDDRPGGWVTADYVMLPASTPQRKEWPRLGHTDSRGTEIQRIIGRALRAVVDLSKIGPHTITLDCQVLQADGGTRTASICGAAVALRDAIGMLPKQVPAPASVRTPLPARYDPASYNPREALMDDLAAVSVGIVGGEVVVDLDYVDDSRAEVDMTVAWTGSGRFVELSASAENGGSFDRGKLLEMIDLGTDACRQLINLIHTTVRSGS